MPSACVELLKRMLDKDPATRITIQNVLEHPYLRTSLSLLPKKCNSGPDDPKKEPQIKEANALGKIFIRKLIDLKMSRKSRDLA